MQDYSPKFLPINGEAAVAPPPRGSSMELAPKSLEIATLIVRTAFGKRSKKQIAFQDVFWRAPGSNLEAQALDFGGSRPRFWRYLGLFASFCATSGDAHARLGATGAILGRSKGTLSFQDLVSGRDLALSCSNCSLELMP